MILLAALALAAPLQWAADLPTALRAAGGGRVVLAFFWKQDCPWCDKLEKETFPSKEFQDLGNSLVPVRLQGDGSEAGESARLGVRGFPTLLFLSSKGRVVGRIQGFVSADAIQFEASEAARRACNLDVVPRSRQAFADRVAIAAAGRNEADVEMWLGRLGAGSDPESAAAHLAAGIYFEEEMRLTDARSHFEKAVLSTDARVRAQALFGLARTYLSTDGFADAARNLEAALAGEHLFHSQRELAANLLKFARQKGGGAEPSMVRR